jgi:hypothetical protein
MLLSSTVVSKDELSVSVKPMPNVNIASVDELYVARRVIIPPRPALPLLPSSMLHIIGELVKI